MAVTSGSVTNPSTGAGYPYPNTFTLSWWVTETGSNYHKIYWETKASGGANGYYQYYYNASAWLSGAASATLYQNYGGSSVLQGATIASGTFTVTHTAEATFTIRVGGGYNTGSSYASADGTWTLPALNSPPTGLNVSNVSATKNTITGTVSITGWGVGANSNRYLELNVSSDKTTNNRRYQAGTKGDTSTSKSLTCSNSSAGNITLTPNSMYYIGAYATNGSANTGVKWDWGTKVTLPDDLSAKSATAIDIHSVKVNYTTRADGNKYAKKIQYSLNNSTWVDGATVSSGSATSGSFNIAGLNPGTQYTVYLRVHTDAGNASSGSVTVKTKSACKIIRGNTVIEAIPKIIKPNGDIIEAKITRI